jgi:deazaflavin-dependent oxidoreductase (nitroreductase family)
MLPAHAGPARTEALGDDEGMRSRVGEAMRTIIRGAAPLARPVAGTRWFPLWAVLEHRGRKSGRAYATPVLARRAPDGFVIPLPWGERTQWLKNVVAAGGATVRWKGTDHALVDPVIIDVDEASAQFYRIQRFLMKRSGLRTCVRLRTAT